MFFEKRRASQSRFGGTHNGLGLSEIVHWVYRLLKIRCRSRATAKPILFYGIGQLTWQ